MKLTMVLFLIATMKASRVKSFLTKSEMCSYQNCNSCDIVLKNTHIKKLGRAIPQCRNLMRSHDCCQKFMFCDVMMECVPQFMQFY